MKKLTFFLCLGVLICVMTGVAIAQPRPKDNAQTNEPKPQPAPEKFTANYQGGIFGYSEKLKGTLSFDNVNNRLVFRNKEDKEVFSIPYKSLQVIYPDSRSVRPTAATVAGSIPAPYGANLPFLFMRKKNRYLIIQFNDPDSDVRGATSFRLENKELLRSVIYTLGEKANLTQRGDAFYRPRETPKATL